LLKFLLENFKVQGCQGPLCPPSDDHAYRTQALSTNGFNHGSCL